MQTLSPHILIFSWTSPHKRLFLVSILPPPLRISNGIALIYHILYFTGQVFYWIIIQGIQADCKTLMKNLDENLLASTSKWIIFICQGWLILNSYFGKSLRVYIFLVMERVNRFFSYSPPDQIFAWTCFEEGP